MVESDSAGTQSLAAGRVQPGRHAFSLEPGFFRYPEDKLFPSKGIFAMFMSFDGRASLLPAIEEETSQEKTYLEGNTASMSGSICFLGF